MTPHPLMHALGAIAAALQAALDRLGAAPTPLALPQVTAHKMALEATLTHLDALMATLREEAPHG